MSRSVSFIEKFEHSDERNMKNLILVFMELVQDQVVKRGVATMDLVMKVMVEEVELKQKSLQMWMGTPRG